MRKKINAIVILIVILALCLCAMVACKPERDADGLLKLKAPQNFEFSGSTVSWDEVDNAQLYYVSVESNDDNAVIDSDEESSTTSPSFNLSTIVSGYGDFTVYVRAYGDGETYGTSDKSKTVYHKGFTLDTPKVEINTADKSASWNAVNDAASYSIRIYSGDNKQLLETTTENTSFSFADYRDDGGEAIFEEYDKYRFVITAMPSDYSKFSDSERGTFYYVNSTTLATPAFSSITSSRIQWGSVTNASSYTLKMSYYADGKSTDGEPDDEVTVETTGTSYQRSNFNYSKVGTYVFTIKAVGDNEVFLDSGFSQVDDAYSVTKLAGIEADDMTFGYDADGKATLRWSVSMDTKADLFYLTLVGLLPDGTSKLENSDTSLTISCNVIFVEGMIYDFYQYATDKNSAAIDDSKTITVYNFEGNMQVRYNNKDYPLYTTAGEEVRYSTYAHGDGKADIFYDAAEDKFVYDKAIAITGEEKDQYTGEDEEVDDLATGNQKCYFEESSSDSYVRKWVDFSDNSYKFEIDLDDIFITVKVIENEGGEDDIDYTYTKSTSNYGILYDVSVSAGQSDDKYVASEDLFADGQYLSYKKVLQRDDGTYHITDAGEYAYMVLMAYVNALKNDTSVINYVVDSNINFNGYEITQIQDFYGTIDGGNHTLSNMVVGNKQLTEDGVVTVDGGTANYSLFVNVTSGSRIDDTFFMGINFVGYEKPESDDGEDEDVNATAAVSEINVAPIAINNEGVINKVMVQSDSIVADGANVAGIVINNNGIISVSQVYAQLEGRNVAGVAINLSASIYDTGFYGSLTAREGEYFDEQPDSLTAAGIAVNVAQNASIRRSEAIGQIEVAAEHELSGGLYAGGLVAINNGHIEESYCGEFTRGANEANIKYVITNGTGGYAGGLVAYNTSTGEITDSYATNKAMASGYAGGFVGRNDGSITSAYSLGGTVAGGDHNGVFAGSNDGTISRVAAYSSNTQVKADESAYLVVLENQGDALSRIVEILYEDPDDAPMQMIDVDDYPFASRFRYPILTGRTYTKDYVVEMSRNQIDPDVSGVAVVSRGDEKGVAKELTIDEDNYQEYIFGDRNTKGNKCVIVLKMYDGTGNNYVKLIYAIVK